MKACFISFKARNLHDRDIRNPNLPLEIIGTLKGEKGHIFQLRILIILIKVQDTLLKIIFQSTKRIIEIGKKLRKKIIKNMFQKFLFFMFLLLQK